MTDQAARLRQMIVGKSEQADGAEGDAAKATEGLSGDSPSPGEGKPQKDRKRFLEEDAKTRVIAITSGKGGVGKTNLTVNLAIALQRAGKRVLVIDADLGMANVDVVLGSMSRKHLLNLLEDGVELSDVLIKGPYGVNYISGGSGIEKAQDFSQEERKLLMSKLAGCGQLADIILLVTTPEPTALTDAYAVMKAYSMYSEGKRLRLVVNRVYDEDESREVTDKLRHTSEKFLRMPVDCVGYIYEDRNVISSVRKQCPFMVAKPKTVASQCVQAMAESLLYGSRMEVLKGWRGFLRQIFNFSR